MLAMLALLASLGSSPDVTVDDARREVVVTARGVRIPAGTHYGHHALETYLPFRWPLRCWPRGYRLEMSDASGKPLSRELLHHAGVANLDRRQLAYPSVERMIGIGRETRPVMLPASLGVPMLQDQQLVRLEPDRRYRVVAVYANPTGETIADGAMAFIAGPFIPDDVRRWPALGRSDAAFEFDRAGLLGEAPAAGARASSLSRLIQGRIVSVYDLVSRTLPNVSPVETTEIVSG